MFGHLSCKIVWYNHVKYGYNEVSMMTLSESENSEYDQNEGKWNFERNPKIRQHPYAQIILHDLSIISF